MNTTTNGFLYLLILISEFYKTKFHHFSFINLFYKYIYTQIHYIYNLFTSINIFASNQQTRLLYKNYFLHVKCRGKSRESWLIKILAPVRQISKYPIVSVRPGLLPVFLYSYIMWLDKQIYFLNQVIYLLLAIFRLCELTAAADTTSAEASYFNDLLKLRCKCCRYYKI